MQTTITDAQYDAVWRRIERRFEATRSRVWIRAADRLRAAYYASRTGPDRYERYCVEEYAADGRYGD